MRKFWMWVFKSEWIPLGPLAPYVLGWALGAKPIRMKPEELPKFDADFSPDHPQNRAAARARGLRYDQRRRVYVDSDGCPMRDRFGQPLG